MNELRLITRHAKTVRRGFGVLILLTVSYFALGIDKEGPRTISTNSNQPASGLELQEGLKNPYTAPEFTGIEAWLNSPPLTMQGLKGKVVLVDFWTYSCINCVHTLPYVTELDRKYRDKGLVIIGVHAPEFEFEKNNDNVRVAIAKHGIHYPVCDGFDGRSA